MPYVRHDITKVLRKYAEPERLKTLQCAMSAMTVETQAEVAFEIKESQSIGFKDIANMWFRAAFIRDYQCLHRDNIEDALVKRDLAMGAKHIARSLHTILNIEDIYFLRLSIEDFCADPDVVDLLPARSIRYYNLVNLLRISANFAGLPVYLEDVSNLSIVVDRLWNINNDVQKTLERTIAEIGEVSPKTGEELKAILDSIR